MFNVRLAGGHRMGNSCSPGCPKAALVVSFMASFMASFVLSFFPLYVLDVIWVLIESGSEGFLTYFFKVL